MAHKNDKAEVVRKKPTATESVDNLIGKKQAEKQVEVSESTSGKMAGVREEVSEIITGAEKPSEKVSKRAGEKGKKAGIKKKSTQGDDDDAQAISAALKDYHFPSEVVMVQRIRTAVKLQIKLEWNKATKLQGNLGSGGADGYNKAVARVRALKQVLSTLFSATVGYLKNVYVKYFTPDGKRRKLDDIQ